MKLAILMTAGMMTASVYAQDLTFTKTINLNSKTDQMRVIAITILAESRGEGDLGMRKVAKTFLCRATRRGIPVYQECLRHASSSFWLHAPSRSTCLKLLACPQADYALYLAADLMAEKDVLPNWEATNFHSGAKPKWAYSPRMKFLEKCGGHYFYLEI